MFKSIPYELMDIILTELAVGLTLVDNTGKVIYYNKLASELLGWDSNRLVNSVLTCHKASIRENVLSKLNQSSNKEWHRIIRRRNRFIENTYSPVHIPEKFTGIMIITKDVTEREKNLNKLKELAEIDHLTGLYNRNYFNELMDDFISKVKSYGILMLDINGLKYINDHFGHEVGDSVIREAAENIKTSIRENDFVFRFGGDEFLVLTSNDFEVLDMIKKRIKGKNGIPTEQKPDVINLSVGYASCNEQESLEDVLSLADDRMYEDKKQFYENEGSFIKRT